MNACDITAAARCGALRIQCGLGPIAARFDVRINPLLVLERGG